MLKDNSKYIQLFSLVFLICLAQMSYSQAYTTVIGGRIADDYGITLKQRIANRTSIEGLYYGGFTNDPIFTDVLVQQHMPLISKRLNIFIGAGVGLRWFNDDVIREVNKEPVIPFVVGADLTVGRLNITADVMPHYILKNEGANELTNNAAISVRYVLIKRKKPEKNKLGQKIEDTFGKTDKEKRQKEKEKTKSKKKSKDGSIFKSNDKDEKNTKDKKKSKGSV